jgi:hypothetical protein
MPKSELSELDRWERNLANGSPLYAQVSARRLRAFLREMDVSAEVLLTLEPRALRNLVEDVTAQLCGRADGVPNSGYPFPASASLSTVTNDVLRLRHVR